MARINPNIFRDWLDGETIDAYNYKREREIIVEAINNKYNDLDGFTYIGVYNPEETYYPKNIVKYKNVIYMMIMEEEEGVTGIEPGTDDTVWLDIFNANVFIEEENERQQNEKERVDAENERQQNEKERVDAENERISNEEGRQTEENTRITNEQERMNNEANRDLNEQDRITSENMRQYNEQLRQDNEQDRENDYYNVLKPEINESLQNVQEAEEAIGNIHHKGEYSESVQYVRNNSVRFNGSSYRALQDTLGNPPTEGGDNEYWALEARKGADGDVGEIIWKNILDKPSAYPPEQHDHEISDIKNLQSELDSKETSEQAQQKADQAEQNAKQYTDEQINNFQEMEQHGNEWHDVPYTTEEDFNNHANNSNLHLTSQEKTELHFHLNKDVLDKFVQSGEETEIDISEIAMKEDLEDLGYGDMLKNVYDTDNDGKVDVANKAESVDWKDVLDKPSAYPPEQHDHEISEVNGLQDELDSKETPAGAQAKAYTAEQNAKQYTDEQISLVTESAVPSGVITMWSGSLTSIPSGWALCDGQNGTPDLRDRFIVGAGSSYEVGDTGGTDNVTLTENQIPQHTHGSGTLSTNSTGTHRHGSGSLSTSSAGNHRHKVSEVPDTGVVAKEGDGSYNSQAKTKTDIYTEYAGDHTHSISGYTSYAGTHSHTISGDTSSAGGGEAHENRPPYYALAYIMKL